VNWHLFRKLSDDTYFILQASREHEGCPQTSEFVRMSGERLFMVTRTGPRTSRVEVINRLNLNGGIPRQINSTLVLSSMIGVMQYSVEYFAATRAAASYEDEDAKVLGRLLVLKLYALRSNAGDFRKQMSTAIDNIRVLRECQARIRVLDELLLHMLSNKLMKHA
jgi:hypothetical protein